MSIMTRWSVATDHHVAADDRAADGTITDAAVDRWVADATATYLERCLRLEVRRADAGLELRVRVRPSSGRPTLARASDVFVTATATEVFPDAFVISVRLRPVGAEAGDPLDLMCEIRLADPTSGVVQDIDNEIRDELIALEHAARHFN